MDTKKIQSKVHGALAIPVKVSLFYWVKNSFISLAGGLGKYLANSTYIFIPLFIGIAIFILVLPYIKQFKKQLTVIGWSFLLVGGVIAQNGITTELRRTEEVAQKINTNKSNVNEFGLRELILKGEDCFEEINEGKKYKEFLTVLVRKKSVLELNQETNGITPLLIAIKSNNLVAFDTLLESNKVDIFKGGTMVFANESTVRKAVSYLSPLSYFFRSNPLEVALAIQNLHMAQKLALAYREQDYEFKGEHLKMLKEMGIKTDGFRVREEEQIKRFKEKKTKVVDFISKSASFLWREVCAVLSLIKRMLGSIFNFCRETLNKITS